MLSAYNLKTYLYLPFVDGQIPVHPNLPPAIPFEGSEILVAAAGIS